jgi:surfactin synthase thioesterase subunit
VAFDAAVWEVWPHLTAGASLVLADESVRTSHAALREWCVAGVLAYAVAAVLEAQGAEVGMVFLLGAANPQVFNSISRGQKLSSKLCYHLDHIRQLNLPDLGRYLKDRARYQFRTRPSFRKEFSTVSCSMCRPVASRRPLKPE